MMRYIAGINSVTSAIEKKIAICQIYVDTQKKNKRIQDLLNIIEQRKLPVHFVDRIKLDLMAPGLKHQGIIAQVEISGDLQLEDILQKEAPLILCLDSIQDPHNLGACLRSAAAAKVDAVIIPKDRAAEITPVVSKIASGGAEMLPIFQVTNLTRELEKCQKNGLWIVALTGQSEQTIYQIDFKIGCVILMGNEGRGVSNQLLKLSDYQAKIPMPGEIESLNVSVATGIVLFESIRQRGL